MMFGADTALVYDALQMAAVIAGATGTIVFLAVRKPWRKKSTAAPDLRSPKSKLEERVEVLERIATDRSIDLADDIERLRDPAVSKTSTESAQ